MKVVNFFKMQLPAKSMNESFARVAVGAFVGASHSTFDSLRDAEQFVWCVRRVNDHDGIDETIDCLESPWFTLYKG